MWWRVGGRRNNTACTGRDLSERVDDLAKRHREQSVALRLLVDKIADGFQKSAKEARLTLGIQLVLVSATIASVLVATWQASSLQSQNELASQARLREIKTADLEFVASVDVNASPARIRISNRSKAPVRLSAIWLLERFDQTERLQEVYGPIEGVPSCGEVSIPRATIIDGVTPEEETGSEPDRSHPDVQEVYLVVKAPSSAWLVVLRSPTEPSSINISPSPGTRSTASASTPGSARGARRKGEPWPGLRAVVMASRCRR